MTLLVWPAPVTMTMCVSAASALSRPCAIVPPARQASTALAMGRKLVDMRRAWLCLVVGVKVIFFIFSVKQIKIA